MANDTATVAPAPTVAPTADRPDELAAFGALGEPAPPAATLGELITQNPVPAALAAAAAGAALMALLTLMTRREPDPLAPVPLVAPRALDFEALKRQIADLADRIADLAPIDSTRQRVERASDAIADGWSSVRDQALDALGRFEPQASAAIRLARENPVRTALIVGAVGALVGSQLLGGKVSDAAAEEPQSDPSADA